MYRQNALKQRLKNGENVFGCWSMLGSPHVVEVLGLSGFDFVIIDQEHGLGDAMSLSQQLHAMSAAAASPIVRVPWNDHVYLKRVLDVGVEGVMIPSIETGEEAAAAVAACRYPLNGRRGTSASSARASNYGMVPDYVKTCAENLLIVGQIESVKGVDNIDAILAVEGIDVIFVGPFDLSASVGQMGNIKHPDVAKRIQLVEQRCRANGRALGTVPHPGLSWKDMFDQGYQFVTGGSDVAKLRDSSLADVRAFRETYGKPQRAA